MKKIKRFIFIIFMLIISVHSTFALSVSEDNIVLTDGNDKTIDLYANVTEEVNSVTFTMVFSTYDIPAFFTVNSTYTDANPDGVKHTINFSEPITGKIKLGSIYIKPKSNPNDTSGTVNIHSASAIGIEDNQINLNNLNINVKINKTVTPPEPTAPEKDPEKPVDNQENNTYNLLKSIDSEIVKLAIKKDVFEYEINIKNDIEELDLKPIPTNENYKVDVSNQKVSELTDNLIIIKVTDDANHTQEYKIKVNVLKDTENIQIDDSNFNGKNGYKGKWISIIVVLAIILALGVIFNKKK